MRGDDKSADRRVAQLEHDLAWSETERHGAEDRLRLVLENTPAAVAILDRDMRYLVVSRRWAQDYGLGDRELVGRSHYEVFPKLPKHWREAHQRCLAGEVIPAREDPFTRVDGAVEWLRWNLNPWRNSEGEICGIVMFCEIITARKEMEQALKRAHDSLETKVAERTVALELARNDAVLANIEISRFLTAASHNLRQPLQAIAALLHVLGKRSGAAQSRAIMEKLDDSIQQMVDMIDTLLDIGQIESGDVAPELSDFPLAAVLRIKAAEFIPLAAAKGSMFRFVPSSAVIQSDRYLMERIVGHLLSSAVKFTRRGSILLGCRRRNGQLRLEVHVSGSSFDEDRGHINGRLDPFALADSGLGLSLFFVQRICELLGYSVDIHTRSAKSTVFAVTLPVSARPAPPFDGSGDAASEPRVPTVLIVEDDPALLGDLAMLVDFEGYHVVTARRGEDAVTALGNKSRANLAAIVIDYNFGGGMNGIDAINAIRDSVRRHVPAVVLTGDRSAEAIAIIEKGKAHYLGKPVKAQVLLDLVEKMTRAEFPEWEKSDSAPIPMVVAAAPVPQPVVDCDIAVIDADPNLAEALRFALEGEGYDVATFATTEEYEQNLGRSGPRCVVFDLDLAGEDVIGYLGRLKTGHPNVPIICLTARGALARAVKAMQAGAVDILEKPISGSEINLSIVNAIARAPDRGIAIERSQLDLGLAKLTGRERQVLEGVLGGKPNKIIAGDLGISQRTAEHHRASVMAKLGVKSLAALVRLMSVEI
jgi:two-component system CheB/CheR fusion protein